jgi:hypothetical protein
MDWPVCGRRAYSRVIEQLGRQPTLAHWPGSCNPLHTVAGRGGWGIQVASPSASRRGAGVQVGQSLRERAGGIGQGMQLAR